MVIMIHVKIHNDTWLWRFLSFSCRHKMMKATLPWNHNLVRNLSCQHLTSWNIKFCNVSFLPSKVVKEENLLSSYTFVIWKMWQICFIWVCLVEWLKVKPMLTCTLSITCCYFCMLLGLIQHQHCQSQIVSFWSHSKEAIPDSKIRHKMETLNMTDVHLHPANHKWVGQERFGK